MDGIVREDGPSSANQSRKKKSLRWWQIAGPGLVSGAADDDPSGIATFASVGAQFGTQLVWTSLFTWPLMAAVQMMCARIGMVTGQGLTAVLQQKFPRWLVNGAVALLCLANVANIAADLAGMADAVQLVGGGASAAWIWIFGLGICALAVRLRYRTLARLLMGLSFALLAYVACALMTRPAWGEVLGHTVMPSLPPGRAGWQAIVALLGTTISPFLFFWQAGQEVEEEKAQGRKSLSQRQGATPDEIRRRRIDVTLGTLVSNIVMFFIIVTAAQTLRGLADPAAMTTNDAAMALKPLAGEYAPWIYAAGLIGTGLLALPTLAGSAAYAVAEACGWRCGLDLPFNRAKSFYGVFVVATLAGALINLLHVNPLRALVWSAMLNGVLAPPLLLAVFLVARDAKLMRGQPSSLMTRSVVLTACVVMSLSVVALCLPGK